MKMVVLDGYTLNPGDLDWHVLDPFGTLTVYPSSQYLNEEEQIARIDDADILFVNKTKITEHILASCPNVQYIGELATGFDNIDVDAARRHGIALTNVPDYGGIAVAQHTMALLLELANRTCAMHERVLRGEWTSEIIPEKGQWQMEMTELAGKTIGFVGYGTIAIYAARMARAFGMRTLGYSRRERPEGREAAEYVDLDTLLKESDVVSLHMPLNEGSYQIINREALAKMKQGSFLINTARGALIDEAALIEAMDSGKVAGFATDVMVKEPFDMEHPLVGRDNVVLTPHIAWGPRATRARLLDTVVSNLQAYLNGEKVNRIC
ncbi:MAG: D-2-hydroxyacid dehydrogenase [Peptococcaceae bacterium]|nr:D-2-hydroxyacid dehydrogenase [Peptococcaceae bacterium]